MRRPALVSALLALALAAGACGGGSQVEMRTVPQRECPQSHILVTEVPAGEEPPGEQSIEESYAGWVAGGSKVMCDMKDGKPYGYDDEEDARAGARGPGRPRT